LVSDRSEVSSVSGFVRRATLSSPAPAVSSVVRRAVLTSLALAVPALLAVGCGPAHSPADPAAEGNRIVAVGAENEYANVISQIGGPYVAVAAIISNPNTDPHTFEASPSVAEVVSGARLIVQNGVGYDDFMGKIESASPSSSRRVIDVQKLLGLPDATPNPHLWYRPVTMPAVAQAVASALSAMQPVHAPFFEANVAKFDRSLVPWNRALAQLRATYGGTPVATTEPVGDYMLEAAGTDNLTPFSLQADIMNGVDPAPQDVSLERDLLTQHRVKVLLYNQQVTDSLTQTFLSAAVNSGVPVVGVYETMPPGYDYQGWMLAEVQALREAVAGHVSTRKL
jgi:zinc/manganese transport system substrate-binding protein